MSNETSTPAPQQYKLDAVTAIKQAVEECPNLYFADYRGLTVGQITELRTQLRESDTRFTVVKNRYTRIALQEIGFAGTEEFLTGPTALALVRGAGDVSAVSKALLDFGRNAPLEVKGGYIDGRLMSPGDVAALSRLPGREQLLAMLLGAMNAPIRNLVSVLHAAVARVARVLQAIADQKASEAGPSEPAAAAPAAAAEPAPAAAAEPAAAAAAEPAPAAAAEPAPAAAAEPAAAAAAEPAPAAAAEPAPAAAAEPAAAAAAEPAPAAAAEPAPAAAAEPAPAAAAEPAPAAAAEPAPAAAADAAAQAQTASESESEAETRTENE